VTNPTVLVSSSPLRSPLRANHSTSAPPMRELSLRRLALATISKTNESALLKKTSRLTARPFPIWQML
jgi:hypothetical protein